MSRCVSSSHPSSSRMRRFSQNEQWRRESRLHRAQVCPCASPSRHIIVVAGQQRLLYCSELRNKSYTNTLIAFCWWRGKKGDWEKAEEGRGREQLWRGKGTMTMPVLSVWERERARWIKRRTGRLVAPELGDRRAAWDESSAQRNEGKERLCGPRRDGWMEGRGMLCHLVERAV